MTEKGRFFLYSEKKFHIYFISIYLNRIRILLNIWYKQAIFIIPQFCIFYLLAIIIYNFIVCIMIKLKTLQTLDIIFKYEIKRKLFKHKKIYTFFILNLL